MSIYKPGRPSKYDPFTGKGSPPPSAPGETRGGTLEWKTADGRSTSRTRRQHEQAKIARHDPPLNRSIGGEGRIAARKKK